jgi:hypothetical protein
MTVHCSWATEPEAGEFPESVAYHRAHGSDLSQCDSWECECGNTSHYEGFHIDDEGVPGPWRCDRCGRLYDDHGHEVTSEKGDSQP